MRDSESTEDGDSGTIDNVLEQVKNLLERSLSSIRI